MEVNDTEFDLFETKKEPKKSFQTFFRNQNKLHVNSFNIIDKKAAIMLRMNSTIISAVIIFYNRVEEIPNGMIIGTVLVISCFVSLMFALNASRPHVFNTLLCYAKGSNIGKWKSEERIFASGAASDLSFDEYQKAFDKVLRSQSLQIGNQVRVMHLFEKYIRKAFIHIEVSYIAFMIGFFITIVLFVVGMYMK